MEGRAVVATKEKIESHMEVAVVTETTPVETLRELASTSTPKVDLVEIREEGTQTEIRSLEVVTAEATKNTEMIDKKEVATATKVKDTEMIEEEEVRDLTVDLEATNTVVSQKKPTPLLWQFL